MAEEKKKKIYTPVAPPSIAGRNYANFKSYMGAVSLPAFKLGETVVPTFDLSSNVDTSKELKFNTLTFTMVQLPMGTGWPTNGAYSLVIPCPEGQEHLYLNLSVRFDPLAAMAALTSKFNVYISSPAPIPTAANSFAVNINPAYLPTLIQVAKQDTTVAEYVLDKTLLPLYIPPKGFLVIFPKDVSVDPDNFDIFVQYERVERTTGLGPLVQ